MTAEASTNGGRNKPSKGWLTPLIVIFTCCAVVGVAVWFSLERFGSSSSAAAPRFNTSSVAPTMMSVAAPATMVPTSPPSASPLSQSPTVPPTETPTRGGTTQAPSVATGNPTGGGPVPTRVPSHAPTLSPVALPPPTPQPSASNRREEVFIAMVEASLPSFNASTPSTRQALDWLLYNDTVIMDLDDTHAANFSQRRLLQRFALACFWFSTHGPADGWLWVWEDQPWMTSSDECTWGGVSCDDATNTVVGLSHSSWDRATRRGALPPELGLLSSLVDLDLRAVSLAGTIPTEIGYLSKLTSIEISHDYTSSLPGRLEGQLPAELFSLGELRTIHLGRNSIRGTLPTEVGLLSNLEVLMLEQNLIGGTLPTELGLCTSLRGLGLRENSFSGSIPSELLVRDIPSYSLYGNMLTGHIPCDVFTQVEIDCGEISCPGGCCCQGFDDYPCSETC